MGGCCTTKEIPNCTETKVIPKAKYVIEIHKEIAVAAPLRYSSRSNSNIDFLSVERCYQIPNNAQSPIPRSENSQEFSSEFCVDDKLSKLSNSKSKQRDLASLSNLTVHPDNRSPRQRPSKNETKSLEIAEKPRVDILHLDSYMVLEKQIVNLFFIEDKIARRGIKRTKTMTKVYLPDGTLKINQYNLVKELKSSLNSIEFLGTDSDGNQYLVTRYSSFRNGRQTALQVIETLTCLEHPNLLSLMEVIDSPKIFIVQEYAEPLYILSSTHKQQLEAFESYLKSLQLQCNRLNPLIDATGNLKIKGSEIRSTSKIKHRF